MAGMTHPLIVEAMKKAAVAWVAADDGPAYALWCMPAGGALWLVTGPGEQQAPGLATATRARVALRGDHGGRMVTWPATVSRVEPRTDELEEDVPQLAGTRLHTPRAGEALAGRW